MEEIETKILDVDRKKIEGALAALDAKKTFDGAIHAFFYDLPDDSIRQAKNTLRLRQIGGRAYLAYKEFVENRRAKIRREHEAEVSDFEEMRRILKSLGLVEWAETRKHRTSYVTPDGTHFELDKHTDQYAYVPEYLEIEAKDITTLDRYAKLLGYSRKDYRPWTILEVAGHYKRH